MAKGRIKRVPLEVMGVSYSKLQTGAYALILAEVGGRRRIPVVIGPAEAQAIAIKMEDITPPRPMTHDLFVSLMTAYDLKMVEVFIHHFEDGIFSSVIVFEDADGRRVQEIDARTSDAIALAMRTGAPVYTTTEVMRETAFVLKDDDEEKDDEDDKDEGEEGHSTASEEDVPSSSSSDEEAGDTATEGAVSEPSEEQLPLAELRRRLDQAIAEEKYEEAARLQAIIKRKG